MLIAFRVWSLGQLIILDETGAFEMEVASNKQSRETQLSASLDRVNKSKHKEMKTGSKEHSSN